MLPATRIDLYQLTSLVTHHAAGKTDDRVVMTFFSRSLPKNAHTGEPARGYLLFAGLERALDHLERARFSSEDLDSLRAHPLLGPALGHALVARLRDWCFEGEVWAPREGTPLLAGKALRPDGSPLERDGVAPAAYCPYLVVETDLLSAKLIETPLLSVINQMTMVATKASQVVAAARERGPGRAVFEFGTRRTHPAAAVDAAVAAYIGGCAATSNVEAWLRYGVPTSGTMDHFAVQAWESSDFPTHVSERRYFEAFFAHFPDRAVLLVDTYDTFGEHTGIRNAVAATGGALQGIRMDSCVTPASVWRARALLDALGAPQCRIFVSGAMDETAIRALGDAPVDGYGVGERIVTSPDAPVGVGAVAKVSMMGDRPSMKLSRGSGKATLPGRLQCWHTREGVVVGLRDEEITGEPLLAPVWTRAEGRLHGPDLHAVRDHARACLDALPPEERLPREVSLRVTPALEALFDAVVRRG